MACVADTIRTVRIIAIVVSNAIIFYRLWRPERDICQWRWINRAQKTLFLSGFSNQNSESIQSHIAGAVVGAKVR